MSNMIGKQAYNSRPEICHPKVCYDNYESRRQKKYRDSTKRSQKRKEDHQWRKEQL